MGGWEKIKETDSHVVEHTPATVGVTGAQTLSTCTVLLTGLHGDLSHLNQRNDREVIAHGGNRVQTVIKRIKKLHCSLFAY